jgi:hypothetical protein
MSLNQVKKRAARYNGQASRAAPPAMEKWKANV